MTRRDDFTNTEAGAAHFAAIAGASEHIGSPVGDQEPDPVWAKALGPDPWEPFTCQRCGSIDSGGMPEKCDGCGLRNYGVER
jgi:hypothetical protein